MPTSDLDETNKQIGALEFWEDSQFGDLAGRVSRNAQTFTAAKILFKGKGLCAMLTQVDPHGGDHIGTMFGTVYDGCIVVFVLHHGGRGALWRFGSSLIGRQSDLQYLLELLRSFRHLNGTGLGKSPGGQPGGFEQGFSLAEMWRQVVTSKNGVLGEHLHNLFAEGVKTTAKN